MTIAWSISIEKYQFLVEKQRLFGHGSLNTTTLKLLSMIYSKFSKRNQMIPKDWKTKFLSKTDMHAPMVTRRVRSEYAPWLINDKY